VVATLPSKEIEERAAMNKANLVILADADEAVLQMNSDLLMELKG